MYPVICDFLAEPRLSGTCLTPQVMTAKGLINREYGERGATVHVGPWRREL